MSNNRNTRGKQLDGCCSNSLLIVVDARWQDHATTTGSAICSAGKEDSICHRGTDGVISVTLRNGDRHLGMNSNEVEV